MVTTILRRRNEYSVAQVDVYSGSSFVWAEVACLALRLVGKPYALTLHGGNLPSFAANNPKRVRRLLGSAPAVTTPSEYLRDQMSQFCRGIRVLPNALNVATYPFHVRKTPDPRLVWLRAFHKTYNPSLAAKVIDALAHEFPNIHLTMIGVDKADGSLQATQKVAEELGVLDRITFVGPVSKSDVPKWLSRGNVFLNTTSVDNAPVSVMEAMACGMCVVSTNVGGIPYLLADEKDALLVPRNDTKAMSTAVRRFFTEPGLATRHSIAARNKALQRDWSLILPEWEQLLANLQSAEMRSADDIAVGAQL